MSITLKKINNEIVKAVPLIHAEDTRPILGSQLFAEIYANIFLCAKKKSGKSSVIYNIIKKCVDKQTTIVAFVSTLHKDKNWATIKLFCKVHNIPFIGHTSLVSEEDGHDILAELINDLEHQNPEEDEEEKEKKPKNPIIICEDDSDDDDGKPKKKPKYRSPEYMFIFDDLSTELKSTSLTSLLKKNRHFKSKIIVSSQYLNDLSPQSRKQLDYFLIFKGQPEQKLDEIYRDADISLDKKTFYKIYKHATQEKFSFLYIDTNNNEYRRNFNSEYNLPDSK